MTGADSPPTTQVKLVVGSLLAFVSQNVIQLVLLLGFDLPKETDIQAIYDACYQKDGCRVMFGSPCGMSALLLEIPDL